MDSLVNDVLDSLDDLGYNDEFDESSITTITHEGPCSSDYTKLVSDLVSELRLFYGIEEIVNPTSGSQEKENFLFEVSGFLSEYGCPYKSLTSGVVTERLNNKQDCLKLLLFLTSELQAAKIFFKKNPDQASSSNQTDPISTLIFDQLKRICIALRMSKPPDDIALDKFFSGIQKKLSEIATSAPPACLGKPVIKSQMGPSHWEKLEAMNEALKIEYSTRRSMLLKRVDVTVSSFHWSDRAKKSVDEIARVYQQKRHQMSHESPITLADLLAARDDLSQVYKTSSGSTRHSCAINKVRMGNVPDRGGRPSEVAPPPPEMPSWQKRQDGGGRGRGHGGYRGGGGDRGYQGQGDNRRRGNDRGGYRGGHGGNRGGYSDRGGYNGRGGHGNGPQSGRGGSRWGRGVGPPQGGAFDQAYGFGGQGYGHGGFGSGQQTYKS